MRTSTPTLGERGTSRHGRWTLTGVEKADRVLRAESVAHPFLVIVLGDGRALMTVLGPGARLTIGRSPQADLPISWDATVSGTHAVVKRDLDLLTVEDLGPSRNGTYVNGAHVDPRSRLEDRDILRCAGTEILVRCPSVPEGSGTAAMAPSVDWRVLSPTERRVVLALLDLWPVDQRLHRAPSTSSMAEALELGESTVKSHLQSIFRKLEVFGVPVGRSALAHVATGFELTIAEIDHPSR